jgi:hypothetical protein
LIHLVRFLDAAKAELSEEAYLTGGEWISLVKNQDQGIAEVSFEIADGIV